MSARVNSTSELKLNNPVRRHQRKLPGVISRRKIAMIALGAIFFTLAADTGYWLYQRFWHTDLRVTIIDVGHGFASLLELPGGYTIMIDGGGFSDNSLFDIGEKVVAPFLWKKKIKTVDTLILSHPNSDHLNGLLYIADHFNVKDVWTNNEPRNTLGYLTLMQIIANKNINLHEFRHMPADRRINGVDLKLLYPPKDFLDRKESEKWRNPNNNSLVVRVSFGHASFLFPGDIMSAAEKELVGITGDKLSSAVLIAPHHGSFSSSTETLLDNVNPKVVIVSSGGNRRFKFPHPAIVKRYERRGYAVFRTDRNGAIRLSTDGQCLSITPFVKANSGNANTWHLRRCSEGKSVSDKSLK
jgi:competence protein ComEC